MKASTIAKPAALFALAGMAGQAHAATTIDVDYDASPDGTPITIGGASSAQYTFFSPSGGFTKAFLAANGTARIGLPGEPTDRGGVYVQDDKTYSLLFDIGASRYSGTATVDSTGYKVTQISYEALSAGGVPEPATWALMILGLGAAGAAMRRRNQAAPRPAIA
ncbi:PEP-CTERM sorting domain-containing protein [Erythrobacter sp. 3-20A1M]|uniref:PEPxxWA-CTERM sorting domain-containing protein n=1 Tax=Erythrobacter sp. 3-20A1M TaxID=2653850 RepID=UPI001BFC06A7|nr:PEPxxWA-CTERM sorting domain-containing protein [Erythrobacter sp. 3-20A1M]QWC57211.1 PEP-CTERM sorting domain-containing protein [Erythrobacter sp. 3-20A1M]